MSYLNRTFLGLAISATLMTSTASAVSVPELPRPATEKPNVVMIYLDDAGYADLNVTGGKFPTPNLDQFAAEGQRWTDFYVSSPVCSPSRAGLLTGRLGVRNGMYGRDIAVLFENDKDGLPAKEETIAEVLSDNGYNTAMLGKWHLGTTEETRPTRHGFDQYYGALTSNDMYWTEEYGTLDDMLSAMMQGNMQEFGRIMKLHDKSTVKPKQEMWEVPVLDSTKKADNSYAESFSMMQQTTFTQDLTVKAKNYIKANKDEPFFLYMAYAQNHVPLFTAPEFAGKTSSLYGDVMQEIDWSVGQLMDYLKEQGIDQNTLVIFASDNGPWDKPTFVAAGHAADAGDFKGGKSSTHEGGVRSPTLIRWPGQIEPTVVEGIGSTLDILPTVAAITGSELPKKELDGVDLSDTLLKGKPSVRTDMPYYYRGNLEAWRSGDWKVVMFSGTKNGSKPTPLEKPKLYNLKTDISETTDVADQYPEVVQRLVVTAEAYDNAIGEKAKGLFDLP